MKTPIEELIAFTKDLTREFTTNDLEAFLGREKQVIIEASIKNGMFKRSFESKYEQQKFVTELKEQTEQYYNETFNK